MSVTSLAPSLLDVAPVIPVVVIEDIATAVPLATALAVGGIRVIEVTLRTPAAVGAISAIAAALPDVLVGAGTVCTRDQAQRARDAGARFLVSPGSTDDLLDAFAEVELPFLAGCATPSDMLRLVERGITEAKLFPAEVVGGIGLLKAVAGPLPRLRFCPTGGIAESTAANYLALANVGCVGGTWLTPASRLATGDWDFVTACAARASILRGASNSSVSPESLPSLRPRS